MFSKFIICLTPFTIEMMLRETSNNGNMGMHGVYLDIYNKRNWLYLSWALLCLSYPCNYTNCGLLFSGLTLTLYTSTIYKWRHILFNT